MKEFKIFIYFFIFFVIMYWLPLGDVRVSNAILEAFKLLQWYARNHTLACVVPALFISGAIITFLSQASVMRYLGPQSNKLVAYSVASVAGVILAVCSCSVLPMFAGIYKLGAGLGPASSFLYSGPAINILAIFLTARILGMDIGIARAIGSIIFAFVIGWLMALIFSRDEQKISQAILQHPEENASTHSIWKNTAFLSCMILFLIFSDWFNPGNVIIQTEKYGKIHGIMLQETSDQIVIQLEQNIPGHEPGEKITLTKTMDFHPHNLQIVQTWVTQIHYIRWYLAGLMGLFIVLMAKFWYAKEEIHEWFGNTWEFAKLLVPILFGGVFLVGFLGALIPEKQVAQLVGDNSLQSNLIASVIGALFYFATLTEVPILQSLMKLGMHKGPALTLLLAGPALSLPSIIAIWKIMGGKKATVFIVLIMVFSALAGMLFGYMCV